ncbi:MAG: hypothetical protein ACREDP_18975, partial [Bradyrhizobium sp.]
MAAFGAAYAWLFVCRVEPTLAHQGLECQAAFPTRKSTHSTAQNAHSTLQNMQPDAADLSLALSPHAENAARQIDNNSRELAFMSASPSVSGKASDSYDVVVVGAGFAGMYM